MSSLGSLCIRGDFGVDAVELAGRVVHPAFQARGIGRVMLQEYVKEHKVEHVATYTRNPSVLKMIGHVASTVFPVDDDEVLRGIAVSMENAALLQDGAAYHIDRYSEEGLFQGDDPADRPLRGSSSLKTDYIGLRNARTALVVAARVRRGML